MSIIVTVMIVVTIIIMVMVIMPGRLMMIARIVIAMIALSVAAICAFAFMRVFGRIVMEANRVKAPSGPPRSAAWHLLHTPTRVLLREYHIARPNGTLGRYLSLFYIMGGAAVIIFVADVWTLLRP